MASNSSNPFDYTGVSSTTSTPASKRIVDVLQILVLIAAFLVVIYLFFIIPTQVAGQSMERNFQDGEILFTNRLVQIAGGESGILRGYDYQRGDVVVFMREGQPDLIKRIIGLPGERVMIRDNMVYVNGVPLTESYISSDKPTGPGGFMPEGVEKVVPEGSYFALGDNRINSLDSRSLEVGFVARGQLRGGSFLRVFPFNSFGFLQRPTYQI